MIFNSFNPVIVAPGPWGLFCHGGGENKDLKSTPTESSGIEVKDKKNETMCEENEVIDDHNNRTKVQGTIISKIVNETSENTNTIPKVIGDSENVATEHPVLNTTDQAPDGDATNDKDSLSVTNMVMNNENDDLGSDDDDEDLDPGGSGTGDAIPETIPLEPGFDDRYATRFNSILNDDRANFQEFCILTDDYIISMKKELNFKNRTDDGAVRPIKNIDPNNPSEIQKLYRKKPYALYIMKNLIFVPWTRRRWPTIITQYLKTRQQIQNS